MRKKWIKLSPDDLAAKMASLKMLYGKSLQNGIELRQEMAKKQNPRYQGESIDSKTDPTLKF